MTFYNQGKCMLMDPRFAASGGGTAVGEAPFELLLDVIRVDLHTAAFFAAIDLDHSTHTDIIATGLGTGGSGVTSYPPRGKALAGKTVVMDTTNDLAKFDASNSTFTGIGNGTNATFEYLALQREQDVGDTDANTLLIAYVAVSATTTNGGNITIVWDPTDGILHLT